MLVPLHFYFVTVENGQILIAKALWHYSANGLAVI